jgi:Regulator of ribonuclease activity B
MTKGDTMKFPKNRDGDDLKVLWKHGVDFRTPQPLAFGIIVPSQDSAEQLYQILKINGFDDCEIKRAEDDFDPLNQWFCIVSTEILLTDVIETKKNLNKLSKRFDGNVNFWVYVEQF